MNKKSIQKFFSEHVEIHVLGIVMATTLVLLISLLLYVKIINEGKRTSYIGRDMPVMNVLPVTGRGEVSMAPNVASFYVTVMGEGKTPEEAQSKAAKINNAVVAYLRSVKIKDADMQTSQVTVYPQYRYEEQTCLNNASYCPPGKQVVDGYQSNQSLTVKIRDVDNSGSILAGLTQAGATNVSGPDFTVEKEEVYKQAARQKAIEDAQMQAQQIASQLGIKLGKVVSFYENSPMMPYYGRDMMMNKAMEVGGTVPELQTGENTISSEVTISYEIK